MCLQMLAKTDAAGEADELADLAADADLPLDKLLASYGFASSQQLPAAAADAAPAAAAASGAPQQALQAAAAADVAMADAASDDGGLPRQARMLQYLQSSAGACSPVEPCCSACACACACLLSAALCQWTHC